MFKDLQMYDWVLQPVVGYPSVLEVLEDEVVRPGEAKFNELFERRTKQLRVSSAAKSRPVLLRLALHRRRRRVLELEPVPHAAADIRRAEPLRHDPPSRRYGGPSPQMPALMRRADASAST
jgi:hypothetical protein